MSMDFKVYQVIYAGELIQNGQELFQHLRDLAIVPGEHGFEYCITNEIDYQDDIICGCISEEHPPDISSVDDDKNVFVPEVAPFMNTYFAIDLREKRLLIQHREYPANNLNRQQTLVRLATLISDGFQEVYGRQFDYVTTNRDVNDDEFIQVFYNNRITHLRVKILPQGRLLSQDTQIFEENDINSAWINGWNADTSETTEIVLKAPGRGGIGDLRESPIAISLINLPVKEILELNYWNDEDGVERMSRTDLRKFRIDGIDRRTQPITGIEHILLDLSNRRDELRRFIAFQNLE